ncbi:MAG: MATE family efflux transporter, partial [Planctomycetota bacterium]
MAAPLVVSFVLRDLLTLIDYPFASRLGAEGSGLGEASLAALGLTQPIVFLMIACWVGASNGLTARLSAAMGAGEGERVDQLKRAAMRIQFVLIAVFLAVAVGIWFFADRLGLDPLVEKQFRIYATVFVASRAVTSFGSILPDSLVKAHHDTKSTMWAGLISGISNFVLNVLFV